MYTFGYVFGIRKSPNAVAVLSGNASNGTELIAAIIDAPVENKP